MFVLKNKKTYKMLSQQYTIYISDFFNCGSCEHYAEHYLERWS